MIPEEIIYALHLLVSKHSQILLFLNTIINSIVCWPEIMALITCFLAFNLLKLREP